MNADAQKNVAIQSVFLFKIKFRALLRKWWLFLTVAVIFGTIGFIYAAMQPPVYKSRLTFALDDAGGSSGGFASLASQFGLNLGGNTDIFSGDNIIEIIKSRRMIERVLLSTDTINKKPVTLIEHYLDISGKRKDNEKLASAHFPAGVNRSTFSYLQDSVLNLVYVEMTKNYIDAQKPDRRLNIFEINITSPEERFSKLMTERLVSETNEYYTELRTKKAKSTLEALENRIEAMKTGLNTNITSRASVKDANLNPVFESSQVPVMQHQAQMEVYSAAYAEIFKNLEVARFQYLNNIPLLQIIDAPEYPMEKIKKSRLKTALLFAILANLILFIILWVMAKPSHKPNN
jgi:uncharacterized protein involved in exopolysaccharide biosynthesis